jgi:hypothetical protein
MNRNHLKSFVAENELLILGGLGVLAFIMYNGGLGGAAAKIGEQAAKALVDAAGGAAAGVIDGVGQGIGLPPLEMNTRDPLVARYILDDPRGGYWEASKYSSAYAFSTALTLPAGWGTPPPPNTPLATIFPPPIFTGGATGDW